MKKDPTKVTNQPALTTSQGKIWLIMGAVLAAVCVAIFIPVLSYRPLGMATIGIVVVIALYIVMIVVRLVVRSGPPRLISLAVAMGCIPVVTIVLLLIIAAAEGAPGP